MEKKLQDTRPSISTMYFFTYSASSTITIEAVMEIKRRKNRESFKPRLENGPSGGLPLPVSLHHSTDLHILPPI